MVALIKSDVVQKNASAADIMMPLGGSPSRALVRPGNFGRAPESMVATRSRIL